MGFSSETKTYIMGLLNDVAEVAHETLYTALHSGSDGVQEVKLLGVILRSKDDFERLILAEEVESRV